MSAAAGGRENHDREDTEDEHVVQALALLKRKDLCLTIKSGRKNTQLG